MDHPTKTTTEDPTAAAVQRMRRAMRELLDAANELGPLLGARTERGDAQDPAAVDLLQRGPVAAVFAWAHLVAATAPEPGGSALQDRIHQAQQLRVDAAVCPRASIYAGCLALSEAVGKSAEAGPRCEVCDSNDPEIVH